MSEVLRGLPLRLPEQRRCAPSASSGQALCTPAGGDGDGLPTFGCSTPGRARDLDVLRQDLDDDARLGLAAGGARLRPHVLARQLVDVVPGALVHHVDDAAADLDVAVSVGAVDDGEGDAGVAAQVARLLAALRRVDEEVGAVVGAPDGGD